MKEHVMDFACALIQIIQQLINLIRRYTRQFASITIINVFKGTGNLMIRDNDRS